MYRRSVRPPHALLALVAVLTLGCGGKSQPKATVVPSAPSPASAAPTDPAAVAAPRTVAAPDTIVDLEQAFESAAETIAPSVVSITSLKHVSRELPPFLRPFSDNDGLARGLGSGVIIDDEGHVMTNNHVVADAESLMVKLADDREVSAEVVGADPKTDIAVIRITDEAIVPATLASSEPLRVGQWVMAVGSPFGLPKTVTAGIISAVGRGGMGITDYGDFIQTDAAVNQGNSGGPLIDLEGRVIGINTAIASRDGGSNGIGFAIPIDLARAVSKQLIERGVVERGWLGVVMGDLTPELAASFDYQRERGVLIDDLDPSGPGARAGLRIGDIVAELDGRGVRDMPAFRNAIAQSGPGTQVRLRVWRDGAMKNLSIELERLPQRFGGDKARKKGKPAKKKKSKGPTPVGLTLVDPDPRLRARLSLSEGGALVSDVALESVASASTLRPGDVVVKVGETRVRSAEHARRLLDVADLASGVRLRVERGGFGRFAVLKRRQVD